MADTERQTLAPHESIELHELINFKTICLANSKLMQGLVFDQDLRALMQRDVAQSMEDLQVLSAAYQFVPFRTATEATGV